MTQPDQRRINACLDACRDISTEALEARAVQRAIAALQHVNMFPGSESVTMWAEVRAALKLVQTRTPRPGSPS